MRKTKILVATLAVATLAIGCGAFAACGGKSTAYDITFDANGGTYAEGAQTVKLKTDKNGRLAAAPTQTPTYTDHSFATYNTAEDGSGTEVTYGVSGYQFKANTTVYAQWVEAGLYTSDGKFVAELEQSTPGDSAETQYGASGIELAPGDVLQIKIKGETITHNAGTLELWTDDGSHGINFDQTAATLTVKPGNERAFDIYAKYYTDRTPCWSIYMSDGLTDEDVLVDGGAYLVGSGFTNADWNVVADNYINPETGLKVTLTSDAAFKAVNYVKEGGDKHREWAYNSPSYYKMTEGKETGYLNFSSIGSDGSGSVLAAGEYTITIEGEGANKQFVFTPADSIQPNLTLNFVDKGFYLVGTGFKTKDANDADKNAEWNLVKEFYIDPEGTGLEIECTKNNKIKLIASNKDAPVWDVYSKNECYKVAAPTEYADKADKYISFTGGEGTVNTAGTYIVKITIGEATTDYPLGKPLVTFAPKGDLKPDETKQVFDYYIHGTMNDPANSSWNTGAKFTADSENEGVYTLTIHLDHDGVVFGFKVTEEGKTEQIDWINHDKVTLTGDTNALSGSGNFTAAKAGTYEFELDTTGTKATLKVTFTADEEEETPTTPGGDVE